MQRAIAACLALVLLAAAVPAGESTPRARLAPPIRDGQHVRAVGRSLVVGGRELRFLGANVAVMHGPRQRAAAEATLDAVAADGLSVVRVWAFGERPAGAAPYARAYAFRIGETGWVEESFAHLDRVLIAARERNLRVIVVLANRWNDYGGMQQYLRWAEQDERSIDPLAEEELTPFWRSARAEALYHAHLRRVVGRVNGIDGTRYADDPTILAWELFNEAAAAPEARDAMVGWIRRAARAIRAIDRNHLVVPGHYGYYDHEGRTSWRAAHALPEIGYCDVHAYPQHLAGLRAFADLEPWIAERARFVRDKPLVWGEIGVPSAHPTLRPRHAWLDAMAASAFARGAAGVLVWVYGPRDRHPSPHRIEAVSVPSDASRVVRDALSARARALSRRAGPPALP